MAETCPECGFGPIGPFTDDCPICGTSVVGCGVGPRGGAWVGGLRTGLLIGWVVIGIAILILFSADDVWFVLTLGICGAAWWGVAQSQELLYRYLGGSLLLLFIPGILLAMWHDVLPGLDRREMTPQRMMHEMMAIVNGDSPNLIVTRARMRTISAVIYITHFTVAFPIALFVPPFLNYRRRRRLGELISLSKNLAIVGLTAWLVLLAVLCWQTWPTVRSFADPPNNANQWPQEFPAADDVPKASRFPLSIENAARRGREFRQNANIKADTTSARRNLSCISTFHVQAVYCQNSARDVG